MPLFYFKNARAAVFTFMSFFCLILAIALSSVLMAKDPSYFWAPLLIVSFLMFNVDMHQRSSRPIVWDITYLITCSATITGVSLLLPEPWTLEFFGSCAGILILTLFFITHLKKFTEHLYIITSCKYPQFS